MVIAAILLGVAVLVLVTWIRMGPRGRERYRRTYRGRRAQSIKETGGSTAL